MERDKPAPLAVAFSGGGDSLALLRLAKTWADQAGRSILALTVDHGLQAASPQWAAWCGDRAAWLGIQHRILVWEGDKPVTGRPAAARAARHRLLADAAREAGARVVLIGHTADDVLEAAIMQDDGVRVSAPTPWSPSPAWPEGRGLYVLRPLLGERRAAIRAELLTAGETWIEDPANSDLSQPRARARAAIAAGDPNPAAEAGAADLSGLLAACHIGPAGEARLERAVMDETPGAAAFLAAAVVCVAGAERPPRRAAVERLLRRVCEPDDFSATLAGARVTARGPRLVIAREAADRRSRPPSNAALNSARSVVYDGRFEVVPQADGLILRPLGGLAARLDSKTKRRLAEVPAPARAAVPAVLDERGCVGCPTLAADPRLRIYSLVAERLAGACGAVRRESDIGPTS